MGVATDPKLRAEARHGLIDVLGNAWRNDHFNCQPVHQNAQRRVMRLVGIYTFHFHFHFYAYVGQRVGCFYLYLHLVV